MSGEDRLRKLIARHFNVSNGSISEQTDFYADLNADILDLPEISMDIELEFEMIVDSKIVEDVHTVGDLQAYVQSVVEKKRNNLENQLREIQAKLDELPRFAAADGGCCE